MNTQEAFVPKIVIGVADINIPCWPWRPLHVILQDYIGEPKREDTHIWTDGSEKDPYKGARVPCPIFAARLEEGVVTKFDAPFILPLGHAVIRLENGTYTARKVEQVRSDRAFVHMEYKLEAIAAITNNKFEDAQYILEMAALTEG